MDANTEVLRTLATPEGFARLFLDLTPYQWQDEVFRWFEGCKKSKVVRGTVITPNGAGKSSVLIPTLVLWWLTVHQKGKVVITTKDGKQLDNQLQPAIQAHRAKFGNGWKFIDRQIDSPSGGRCVMFTTDQAGRAEGWHKIDDVVGPLLIIVDEAKSVDKDIFEAFDRCTYNGLLYVSSPGKRNGVFYDSQMQPDYGFLTKRVGLADCPHIPEDRIEQIIRTHGEDSAFTRSTLYGEFMDAEGELRFDCSGIDYILDRATNEHKNGLVGVITENRGTYSFLPDPNGWVWTIEAPREDYRYMATADPMTGEFSAGGSSRDTHACGILRESVYTEGGLLLPDELVATLYAPEGAVRWDIDILAKRLDLLSKYYGNALIVPESNNSGMALIAELRHLGSPVWLRTEIVEGNTTGISTPGFQTNSRTREMWVEKVATAIRERSFLCRYLPAAQQFKTFIFRENGKAEAQEGCHDDWVASIGIGLLVRAFVAARNLRTRNADSYDAIRKRREAQRRNPAFRKSNVAGGVHSGARRVAECS